MNDIIKTKEDLHKLRKEYDDLKLNMVQVYKCIGSLIHIKANCLIIKKIFFFFCTNLLILFVKYIYMLQQSCQIKYDEKLNKWKNHIIDLEDQIRVLQHEVNVTCLLN